MKREKTTKTTERANHIQIEDENKYKTQPDQNRRSHKAIRVAQKKDLR